MSQSAHTFKWQRAARAAHVHQLMQDESVKGNKSAQFNAASAIVFICVSNWSWKVAACNIARNFRHDLYCLRAVAFRHLCNFEPTSQVCLLLFITPLNVRCRAAFVHRWWDQLPYVIKMWWCSYLLCRVYAMDQDHWTLRLVTVLTFNYTAGIGSYMMISFRFGDWLVDSWMSLHG